jgi:hypothetical protein
LLFLPREREQPNSSTAPALGGGASLRRKGSAAVGFFVKRGDRVQRGSDGEHVQPGDQLRFTLRSDRPTQLAILSLDARGVVSVYFPRTEGQGALRPIGEELALDAGVELDATLGPETIFAIRCPTPPALAAHPTHPTLDTLRNTLQRTRTLPAPPGCEVDVLRLFKEPIVPPSRSTAQRQ